MAASAAKYQQKHNQVENRLSPSPNSIPDSPTSTTSSNTDSDSMKSDSLVKAAYTPAQNGGQVSPQPGPQVIQAAPRSPILIKYNYYDIHGARQEQSSQDLLHTNMKCAVRSQMSPDFEENLDQVVRNSQKHLLHGSNNNNNLQRSPTNSPEAAMIFSRRYKLDLYEQLCVRCQKTVYQMDKVGPLKEFTFFHQNCFKCRECGTKLTLKTYFNNQQATNDLEVYCQWHCPKTGPGKLDNQSVGIRAALNAPKVFDPTSGNQFVLNGGLLPPANWAANQNGQLPVDFEQVVGMHKNLPPNVDSRALYIQHAVQQTRLQNIYKQTQVDKKISQFISRRLEYLEPKQKMLEMRHREEEDALFKVFEVKWHQEDKSISEQIKQEWQVELAKLLDKYKRQLSNISGNKKHLASLSSQQQVAANSMPARQQEDNNNKMIEFERMNLEKTMTIKLDRKKETLRRKLKEFERQATADLVEKQSKEMLALISLKLDEFKQEQRRKIGSDLEQFEAIELLANRLGSSLQFDVGIQATDGLDVSASRKEQLKSSSIYATPVTRDVAGKSQRMDQATTESAPPRPPQIGKLELYNNQDADLVFKRIDQIAIGVAQSDQQTFTDLVHHLTRHCLTDVEKVRAIFRWITVKNLNTMHFDASLKPDSPLGLLRGIKYGSESYHVLFKRLCSYAGLHCVVIKGYSKSAGYQPGVCFEGNRFKNSWNAVFVAGSWRFVQCNWGARHLVSVAVMQDKNQSNGVKTPTTTTGDSSPPHAGLPRQQASQTPPISGRSRRHNVSSSSQDSPAYSQHGRRGLASSGQQVTPLNGSKLGKISSSPSGSSSSSGLGGDVLSPDGGAPLARQQTHHTTQTKIIKQQPSAANDSLRYEYDDHYFLTDPEEFIYEFYPLAADWQLIKSRPISLHEFEQLPFVRSLFFKYGLYFPQTNIRSVLSADSSGATTIKIGMPTHMIPKLIFHYNLKYFDSEQEHYQGVSLKRFVMQSVESGGSNDGLSLLSNIVSFRVHLPENGAYILDIFANSTPTQYITGEPMKFKSVSKFKIVARNIKTVMIPLPDCASGEFGPMKAMRLFGLVPITHENGLISVQNDDRQLEIQFRMTRSLPDFMATLHKNGYDEKQLSKSIQIFTDGDIVFVRVVFVEDGQYGLDIYTRDQTPEVKQSSPNSSKQHQSTKRHLLTHCCKYLINVRTQSRQ